MLVIRTSSLDLWRSLAAEERLLELTGEHRRILFLWQAENAVVVGKNQNPWRECRVRGVLEESGVIARRVSGGGAVYQDLGNLNFAFFTPRTEYDPAWSFDLVLRTLGRLGVKGQLTGRNTLSAKGRKFSGNAYCFRRGGAMHHGTLLVSSDLERQRQLLERSSHITRTRAVASQPSEVVNLAEIAPSLTVEKVADALEESFAKACGAERAGDEFLDGLALRDLRAKYLSWDWRFGMTPPFDVELSGEFDGEEFRARLYVERGVIEQAVLAVSGRRDEASRPIEEALVDTPLEENEIFAKLLVLSPVTIEEWLAFRLARWLADA